jgi:Flp pilus assembly protein TadG
MRIKFFKTEEGQAMVEFALILPLLILLLCGIIDFGWIFGNQLILNNAGRDTARTMAINYDINGGDVANDATTLSTFQNRLGAGNYLNNSNLVVNSTLSGSGAEEKVTVTATYPLPFLTPLLSTILQKTTITIDTETTMRLE